MPLIKIDLPDVSQNESTQLTAATAVAATTSYVRNAQGFSANDYVVYGPLYHEKTEIRKLATVNSDLLSVTHDALKFAHSEGDPITFIRYNQAKIYGSETEDVGDATLLATVALEVDNPKGTYYYDATADIENYWIAYYNSYDDVETEKMGPIPTDGFDPDTLAEMILDVMELINDPKGEYLTAEQIRRKLNNQQQHWWFTPYSKRNLAVTEDFETVQDQEYIVLPKTFDRLAGDQSVWYTYENGGEHNEYPLEIVSEQEYKYQYADKNAPSSDEFSIAYFDQSHGENRLYIGKAATAGLIITVKYFQKPAKLVDPEDKTLCPVPRILTLGVAMEVEIRRDPEIANQYRSLRQELLGGELYHGKTTTGSSKIRFLKNYGRNRYRSGRRLSGRGEW